MIKRTPPTHSFDLRGFIAAVALIIIVVSAGITVRSLAARELTPSENSLAASVANWLIGKSKDVSNRTNTLVSTVAETVEAGLTKETTDRVISIPTVEESVPATGKFIGVDLKQMKLSLYEDGALVQTFDVQSKGRPGSRWDTPSGKYEVLYKNESHFSSIGHVYMPWSMQFFGNFFIHGWPYYPDGTPVDEGYSGGCIRLSTEDAGKVFAFASVNTPIYVYDTESSAAPSSSPSTRGETAAATDLKDIPLPQISAKSYLIADLTTGEVFAERNPDTKLPIASISKLITAVVANETIGFDRLIPVSAHAYATYGEQGGILAGERFTITDLYFPLLLNSSNDAAVAIAEYGAGFNNFVGLMNRKAEALDMTNTSFADPSGLSPQNISTASDLFKLAKYIHEKKRFIFDTTMLMSQQVDATATAAARTYTSNNPMRGRADWLGGKNGFTDEARKTLLSLFEVHDGTKDRTIVVIVLSSEDHTGDTEKLNEWINASFK